MILRASGRLIHSSWDSEKCTGRIVDTNSMYNDIRASLEASLTGQTYQPDTGKLRTKLKENVENYAKSREIELGEAQQTVLNTYLEQAADQYVRQRRFLLLNIMEEFTILQRK